jgi:hypothetical protein
MLLRFLAEGEIRPVVQPARLTPMSASSPPHTAISRATCARSGSGRISFTGSEASC